jgi:phosphoglucosamine mutase
VTLRFGTDGVRGVANAELTPELVLRLGRAASRVIGGDDATFYVGRDTRVSGPLLQAALTAGLAAEGASVVDLGVLPTPGVAWLSAADGVPAAMISASHNAFADNGIKFFAAGGRKLPDEVEERLEAELDRLAHPELGVDRARIGTDLRPVRSVAGDAITRYCDALVASLEGRRLDGLHIVVDCAHGAASDVAPAVLRRLGAGVEVIHAQPDGVNINAGCGSTHPESLQRSVVALGADAGLAFDGDADRVLAVDASGAVVDGDQLIAICALDLRSRGGLKDDTVVVTVMTNLGFHLAMAEHGVHVEQTAVGDRYVLEALARGGWSLGGEQSGHVIFSELATTGDGVLTGLQVLDVVRRSGRPLAELASVMTRLPQVLENVRVRDRDALLDDAAALDAEVAAVEAELGDHGRVLIRPSGTEPLVRVMVEAPTPAQASAAAARLVAAVTAVCGTA